MVYILLISLISALEFPLDVKSTKTSSVKTSTELLDDGLVNYSDLDYFVRLTIGNPEQKINLALNLKHSASFIPLIECNCHSSTHRFSPFDSYTFKNTSSYCSHSRNYYNNSYDDIRGVRVLGCWVLGC